MTKKRVTTYGRIEFRTASGRLLPPISAKSAREAYKKKKKYEKLLRLKDASLWSTPCDISTPKRLRYILYGNEHCSLGPASTYAIVEANMTEENLQEVWYSDYSASPQSDFT